MKTVTSIVNDLPVQSRKTVFKSLVGSLNSSVIGYIRGHLRGLQYERREIAEAQEDAIPTIDVFNKLKAKLAEEYADTEAIHNMGLTVRVQPLEVARDLERIRMYAIASLVLVSSRGNREVDAPLSIANTLNFQTTRAPDINEPALRALATALNQDFEVLKMAKVKILKDERSELIAMGPDILDESERLSESIDVDLENLEDDAEAAFKDLPPAVQLKTLAAVSRAFKSAGNKALKSLLQYNKIEAAGDITMLKAALTELREVYDELLEKHSVELNEFVDAGGQLPELATLG